MLDSSSRMLSAKRVPTLSPLEPLGWEESTFTRPMRSPFDAVAPTPSNNVEIAVDVSLEEAALFEPPKKPALRRITTAPPPRRSVPPRMDEEATSRNRVDSVVLRAMREPDSARLRQALAIDLAKTVEEPSLDVDQLETSTIRTSD